MEIYYEELAYAIRKADKSWDLLYTGDQGKQWYTSNSGQFKSLRTRGANEENPRLRAGENEILCSSSSSGAKKGGVGDKFVITLPFILFRPQDWMPPTTLERTTYFTESTDSNANRSQKHPHRHTQKQCLICVPHGPLKLTYKIIMTPKGIFPESFTSSLRSQNILFILLLKTWVSCIAISWCLMISCVLSVPLTLA